jgi:hypothetical protein
MKKIITHFGVDHQRRKFAEENLELQEAIIEYQNACRRMDGEPAEYAERYLLGYRMHMIEEIAEADTQRMKELSKAAQEVQDAKANLMLEKQNLEDVKAELDKTQEELNQKKADSDALLQELLKKAKDLDELELSFEERESRIKRASRIRPSSYWRKLYFEFRKRETKKTNRNTS